MESWGEFCSLATPKVEQSRAVERRFVPLPHSGFRPIHFPPQNLPLRKAHPITLPIQQPLSPFHTPTQDATVPRLDTVPETHHEEEEPRVGYPLLRFQDQSQAEQFLCLFCRLVCSPDFLACSLCGSKYCRVCVFGRKSTFSQICPNCSGSCALTVSDSQALVQAIQTMAEGHRGLVLGCRYREMGCEAALPLWQIAGHEGCCRFRQISYFQPNLTDLHSEASFQREFEPIQRKRWS